MYLTFKQEFSFPYKDLISLIISLVSRFTFILLSYFFDNFDNFDGNRYKQSYAQKVHVCTKFKINWQFRNIKV